MLAADFPECIIESSCKAEVSAWRLAEQLFQGVEEKIRDEMYFLNCEV